MSIIVPGTTLQRESFLASLILLVREGITHQWNGITETPIVHKNKLRQLYGCYDPLIRSSVVAAISVEPTNINKPIE